MLYPILNAAICLLTLGLVAWRLRQGYKGLFTWLIVAFLFTNVLGLCFVTRESNTSDLFGADIYSRDPSLFVTQCMATWLFLGILMVLYLGSSMSKGNARRKLQDGPEVDFPTRHPLETPHESLGRSLAEARQRNENAPVAASRKLSKNTRRLARQGRGMGNALVIVGIVIWSKFMLIGPGLSIARATNFMAFNFEEAVASRFEAFDVIEPGQGFMIATIAAFVIIPLGVAASNLTATRLTRTSTAVVTLLGFTASMLMAFTMRQKAPVLLTGFTYASVFYMGGFRETQWFRKGLMRKSVFIIIGGILSLAIFYSINEGGHLMESIRKAITRLLLIPVVANGFRFYLFPECVSFGGVFCAFGIEGVGTASGGTLNPYEIAEMVCNSPFCANACCMAVGWTGLGYAGVAVVAVVIGAVSIWADRALGFVEDRVRYCAYVLSIPSIIEMNSCSFRDYIGFGGGIICVALYVMLRREPRRASGSSAKTWLAPSL